MNNRHHIIAAAQRHNFISRDLCNALEEELQNLYALAGIIFQESVGWYRELKQLDELDQPSDKFTDAAGNQVMADLMPFLPLIPPKITGNKPYFDASIGIAQIRPIDVAKRIETDDLLYHPFQSSPGNPVKARYSYMELMAGEGRGGARVLRLLNDAWAIEYAAANMQRATMQPLFHQYSSLSVWQRMASWYNQGIFDVNDPERGGNIVNYMDLIWRNALAIRKFDLLGIEANCSTCSPPYLPIIQKP